MSVLKKKLREQVHIQHQFRSHVESSPFHLQIEFENMQNAREFKALLRKNKSILGKEKQLRAMMLADEPPAAQAIGGR